MHSPFLLLIRIPDRFNLALQGNVAHTGFIPASISFPDPVNVSWVEPDKTETPIGWLKLDSLHASSKRATINQTETPFNIGDEAAFSRFTAFMITSPSFTWKLHSSNLRVQAAKVAQSSVYRQELSNLSV